MVFTVIVAVVALLDQTLPEVALEVKSTEPPVQNVVEPLAVITGVAGSAFTVTVMAARILSSLFALA